MKRLKTVLVLAVIGLALSGCTASNVIDCLKNPTLQGCITDLSASGVTRYAGDTVNFPKPAEGPVRR